MSTYAGHPSERCGSVMWFAWRLSRRMLWIHLVIPLRQRKGNTMNVNISRIARKSISSYATNTKCEFGQTAIDSGCVGFQ